MTTFEDRPAHVHLRTFARQADRTGGLAFRRSTLYIDSGPSVFGYEVQFNMVVLPQYHQLMLQSEAGDVTVHASGSVSIPAPPPP